MRRWALLSIIAIVVMLLLGFILLYNSNENYLTHPISENNLDIAYGDEKAQLQVFFYMDYTCMHCRKFLINTFPKVKQVYIDKGLLKFNIKLLSISADANIMNAYKMAVCLNQHGDFSELNKLLLYETGVIFSKEFIEVYDALVERNASFASCMYSGESEDYLQENAYGFVKNEFTGTPTFVVNNRVYKGYKDFNAFSKIIDAELMKLK